MHKGCLKGVITTKCAFLLWTFIWLAFMILKAWCSVEVDCSRLALIPTFMEIIKTSVYFYENVCFCKQIIFVLNWLSFMGNYGKNWWKWEYEICSLLNSMNDINQANSVAELFTNSINLPFSSFIKLLTYK